MKFQAKYYDGQKPLSVLVTWELRGEAIIVSFENGHETTWPISELEQDVSHNTAVVLLNKITQDRIELLGGEATLSHTLLKQTRVKFSAKMFITFIVGILTLMILYWQGIPVLINHIAQRVPIEHEKMIADKLMENVLKDLKACRPSPEAENALKKIITSLNPQKDLDIKIINSSEVNAFTFPGGKIVIFSGLLKQAKSSDELAGIVAHEIAHARRRHPLQGILTAVSTTVFIQFLTGDFSSVFAMDPSTLLSLGALTFDRRMEREADEDALETIIKLGLNPVQVGLFFQRERSTPDSLAFLSTHPGDEERSALFRSKKIKYSPVPLLSASQWKSLQSYCENSDDPKKIKRVLNKNERSSCEAAEEQGSFHHPQR
jgi:Zn-dependent protease with chaperone function